MATISVVLVDDDQSFAGCFGAYLEAHGFAVAWLMSLAGLGELLRRTSPAILILNQFLGNIDAIGELPRIRDEFFGGILMLTNNQEAGDCVIGLELGADDFISKAQPPVVMLARLRALFRRVERSLAGVTSRHVERAPTLPSPPQGWQLSHQRRELTSPDGSLVAFTTTEFALIAYLHARTGIPVTRDDLSRAVLSRAFSPEDRSIDNLVARIRSKLRRFVGDAIVIRSLRAVGYVFVGFDRDALPGARIAGALAREDMRRR